MELIKQEFPFLFKETFSIKKIPFCLGGTFIPLNILFCNGEFEFPFSEASLRVIGYPAGQCKRKLEGFHEMNIYFGFIYDLVFNKNCTGELEMRRKSVLKNLGEFLTNERHFKCLERLHNDGKDEKESVLQEVLAVHLFGPLLKNAIVKVDNTRYKATENVKCKYCNVPVMKADTSFGNSAVWHGYGDILLEHSVVAIEPGEDEEEDESTQPYSYSEESTDTDEPEAKRMRVTASGDGESSKQEPVVNFIEVKQASNDYLPNGPKGIPYCEDDVKGINKTLSQVLAQTITNAFLQVKLHPYLINQFIPSFLANNKYVTIHMYNPNEDILLTQGQAMPIISSNKLNYETVLSIWLALNMFQFLKARKNPPEFDGLSKELKQKKCNFQKLIRGDKLNIYFDELHMPLKKSKSPKEDRFIDSSNAYHYVLDLFKPLQDGVSV